MALETVSAYNVTSNGDFLAKVALGDEVLERNPCSREHHDQVLRYSDRFAIHRDSAAAVEGSRGRRSPGEGLASDGLMHIGLDRLTHPEYHLQSRDVGELFERKSTG
jgi:hypothetical protein